MRRYYALGLITVAITALMFLGIKLGLGWKSLSPPEREGPLIRNPVLWSKFVMLISLQISGKQRPYTEQEMSLIRKAISDPTPEIRSEAVAALRYATHDLKQRQEAIKLITRCLKDPNWLVRSYAVRSMAELGVKEAIPQIIPLLNDPRAEVREEAKRTLQKLGYQIGKGN